MSDYIHLIGSEDVSRAGYVMRDAAETMARAAASISESVETMRRILEDHAQNIKDATAREAPGMAAGTKGTESHGNQIDRPK